jgi:septum formation protein
MRGMPTHDFLYLSSQSPRRRQLLDQIGARHELLLPDPHEDAEALEAERPGELPSAYVQRVTRAKLDAARARHARRPTARGACGPTARPASRAPRLRRRVCRGCGGTDPLR